MIISTLTELDPSALPTDDIVFKLASTREEREAALRLVYRSYLRAGLMEPNEEEIRITPHHLLPSTAIFVAKVREEVVSTVSLVCDGELGLPISHVYGEEIERRKQRGIKLGELTCLADRRKHLARRLTLLLGLFRLMAYYARQQGVDQLVIAVHPKHAPFYQRLLKFERIGDERAYTSVLNNPAVALCLDFARVDRERPLNYDKFFGIEVPGEHLQPQPMSPEELAYFSAMRQRCEPAQRRVG